MKTMHLLLFSLALVAGTAHARSDIFDTYLPEPQDSSGCASDSVTFNVNDWEDEKQKNNTMNFTIMSRLSWLMGNPKWANVRTVVSYGRDRPDLQHNDNDPQANARVTFNYCWERNADSQKH